MERKVKALMLALSDYAVVGEDQTILDALKELQSSQEKLPPGRQPHRAILVRNSRGEIVGKLHHFAFLRALIPERKAMGEAAIMDRAGLSDDIRDSSMKMLDLLTAGLVDVCERAKSVRVRDVYTTTTISIDENATLAEAINRFVHHQTLSLLVTRGGKTVGILRLSDLFDELARQIMQGDCMNERD
jgi:CBS domain-containing protein